MTPDRTELYAILADKVDRMLYVLAALRPECYRMYVVQQVQEAVDALTNKD